MEIFTFIGESVTNATDTFMTPAVTSMIDAVNAVMLVCVTIYIALIGFATVTGIVESPIKKMLSIFFKISLITGFAFTLSNYDQYVIQSFASLETDLVALIGYGESDADTIFTTLDSVITKGASLAALCLQNADDAGWNFGSVFGWWLAAFIVAFGTALVGVMGGAAIIIAKFAIAILLSIGPLFIFCLIFPITARFFSAWFSQTLNYTLLIVIVAVVMAFAIASFNELINGANLSGDGEQNPLFVSVQIFVLTFILIILIRESRGIAAGLAGGLSMSALSIAQAFSPATTITDAVNAKSTRRDLESGMMTTGGRLNHIVAGNTIANPAYLQNIGRQIGKNWSSRRGGNVSQD